MLEVDDAHDLAAHHPQIGPVVHFDLVGKGVAGDREAARLGVAQVPADKFPVR